MEFNCSCIVNVTLLAMVVANYDYDRLQVAHNASPVTPLTIVGTVLKESDDLVILGVTFDYKLSFSKTWYLEEVLASVP